MKTEPQPTEAEVRAMRDRVAESKSSDENWAACRENWLRPDSVEWLQKWVRKMDAKGKA